MPPLDKNCESCGRMMYGVTKMKKQCFICKTNKRNKYYYEVQKPKQQKHERIIKNKTP